MPRHWVVEIVKQLNPSKLALPPKVPHTQCATWYMAKNFYCASEHILNGEVLGWSPAFGIKGVIGGRSH